MQRTALLHLDSTQVDQGRVFAAQRRAEPVPTLRLVSVPPGQVIDLTAAVTVFALYTGQPARVTASGRRRQGQQVLPPAPAPLQAVVGYSEDPPSITRSAGLALGLAVDVACP